LRRNYFFILLSGVLFLAMVTFYFPRSRSPTVSQAKTGGLITVSQEKQKD